MVDARLLKAKTKVLTLTRAKETRTVDLGMKISANEYREIRRHHDQQKSRYEQMAAVEGKGLSALVRRETIPASTREREV